MTTRESSTTDCSALRWRSVEELDADCDGNPWLKLTGMLDRVRERMALQEDRERLRDARSVADFLRQPVIYSHSCNVIAAPLHGLVMRC